MMRIDRCRLGFAVAFCALALGANAQPTASSQSHMAPATQSATATPAAKSGTAAKSMHAAKRSTKHRPSARRESRSRMTSENTADSAYKAALRRCVTGPQSARDQCLDQAIAQYGHA